MKSFQFIAICLLTVITSCHSEKTLKVDPLPSWNETTSKHQIIDFVTAITDKNHPDFVAAEDRVATFDNDGTLWTEKPIVQIQFAFDRVQELSKRHPEWQNDPIIKAVLNNDLNELLHFGKEGLAKVMMLSHSGMTTDEFDETVSNWIATAKHHEKNKSYNELIYQPMLEVIDYLKENDFKVFIVSGGGMDFMRPWAEKTYGIPKNQIIGSSIKVSFEHSDEKTVLNRLPELNFFDDKAAKPVAIHRYIGRKPIAAFGNSDGDLQMLQWSASNKKRNLQVYVSHTDDTREYLYGRKDPFSKLDKGMDQAIKNGWTIADMKKDWKVVYPFELISDTK